MGGGDFTQLVAVSSLVSNQLDQVNRENQMINKDHHFVSSMVKSTVSYQQPSVSVTSEAQTPSQQMRDALATKAALKEIDHKKIQDKQRKRQRKTNDQKSILENEFLKDPNWDYEKKCELALALNFTFA